MQYWLFFQFRNRPSVGRPVYNQGNLQVCWAYAIGNAVAHGAHPGNVGDAIETQPTCLFMCLIKFWRIRLHFSHILKVVVCFPAFWSFFSSAREKAAKQQRKFPILPKKSTSRLLFSFLFKYDFFCFVTMRRYLLFSIALWHVFFHLSLGFWIAHCSLSSSAAAFRFFPLNCWYRCHRYTHPLLPKHKCGKIIIDFISKQFVLVWFLEFLPNIFDLEDLYCVSTFPPFHPIPPCPIWTQRTHHPRGWE